MNKQDLVHKAKIFLTNKFGSDIAAKLIKATKEKYNLSLLDAIIKTYEEYN